jgi:hypothetical protein
MIRPVGTNRNFYGGNMKDMSEYLAFRKMITPLLIQVIFWVLVVVVALVSIGSMIAIGYGISQTTNGFVGFLIGLIVGVIYLVFGILGVRMYCEIAILLFRMYDELAAIRNALAPGAATTPQGFPVMPTAPPAYVPPQGYTPPPPGM